MSSLEGIVAGVPLIVLGLLAWLWQGNRMRSPNERTGDSGADVALAVTAVVFVGFGVVLVLSTLGGVVGSVAREVVDFYEKWTEAQEAPGFLLGAILTGFYAALIVLFGPFMLLGMIKDGEWASIAPFLVIYVVALFIGLSITAWLGWTEDPVAIVRDLTGL